MSVARKQRYASSGVQTIGSPRTLKLVFTSTGQPVRRSNASSKRVNRGFRCLVDGLNPRTEVDMGHGGNLGANHVDPVAKVGVFLHHSTGLRGRSEPGGLRAQGPPAACRGFPGRARDQTTPPPDPARTAGAKGRKLSRNLIFRFIVACIAGDRGSPRMLRAPSARGPNSIRPWNQPTILPSARSPATCSTRSGSSVNCCPCLPCPARNADDLIGGVARPEEAPLLGILHHPGARFLQELMPDEQGRPQRPACIAGRRLDPDIVKCPLAQEPAIGHTVEPDSARHDQMPHPGSCSDVAADPEDDLFGHILDAGGQVHVPLLEG